MAFQGSLSFILLLCLSAAYSQESPKHELEADLQSLDTLLSADPEIVSFLQGILSSVKKLTESEEHIKTNVEELKTNVEKLTESNEKLTKSNEELTKSNEELTKSNEELTKSNGQIIANVEKLTISNTQLKINVEKLEKEKERMEMDMKTMKLKLKDYEWNLMELKRYKTEESSESKLEPQENSKMSLDNSNQREKGVALNSQMAIEQILKVFAPATCQDWKVMGFDNSGYYPLDPDGQGLGDPPFTAYCDMDTGYSYVHHDQEQVRNTTRCGGPGCYQQDIEYQTSMTQMKALIMASQSCQQMISIDCKETPLSVNGVDYSWWVDRSGNSVNYWAGDGSQGHSCSCGYTNVCVNPEYGCNCDSDLPEMWLQDDGSVSNSAALPVTSVHFGSENEQTPTQIHYEIGPLRCFGRKSITYPESCMDLLLSGVTVSGYYYIGQPPTPTLVFCDLTDPENSVPTQRDIVMFSAYLSSDWATYGYVIYDRVDINEGDGYNPTTGIFTCKKSGYYFFGAYAYFPDGNNCFFIRVNGNNNAHADTSTGTDSSVGRTVLIKLKEGDKVTVFLYDGQMHSGRYGSVFYGMFLADSR